MKYILSIIMVITAIVTFSSCNKDSIDITESPLLPTGETVSGTAHYYHPAGVIDPMVKAAVFLGDSIIVGSEEFSMDTVDITADVLKTFVDEDGNYIFEGVTPKMNQVIRIFPPDAYSDLVGEDSTLDGDINEELQNELIQISIEEDEIDDGNDFRAYNIYVEPIISVSGFVLEDTDMDLIGDTPIVSARLVLIDYDLFISSVTLVLDTFPTYYSQGNGYYEFYDVPPGEYVVQHISSDFYNEFNCLSSMDQSPEAGEIDIISCNVIAVNLTAIDSTDHDNVFVFSSPGPASISGYTLEDTDMDLIGDTPVEGSRLELHQRGPYGLPSSVDLIPLAWDYSDENGYYEFRNIPSGEYVIYHIGSPSSPYICVSYSDQSPELGEPDPVAGCTFIPVNLTDMITIDSDNIYVFSDEEVATGPGSLAGEIFEDITSDGQPDELTDLIVTLDIYERDSDGFTIGPILYSTDSNADGSYSLDDIAIGEYAVKLRETSGDFMTIFGRGNGGPQPRPDVFPLTITAGAEVLNTYFWIYTSDNTPSISGQVYEDTDADNIGDVPQYDHTIEVYLRGSDNFPTGDLIYKTNTSGGGSFYFTNLSTNNYVLVLTGPSEYSCVVSEDESPENGEPISTIGCEYILVDFVEGVVDEGNHYVVRQ